MQLKKRRHGKVWRSLGMVTANLFVATHGIAQAEGLANEPGTTSFDSAVLFYSEAGGRVQAIEPVASLRINRENGSVFTARLTYDSLTGATPNGAAPWRTKQTFTEPTAPPGKSMTVTSASGHQTIVTIPGTGTVVAQYTANPHILPVDAGFKDTRYAFNTGYTAAWQSGTNTSIGFDISSELDYSSYSVNAAISQAFNQKNTTLSLGVNFEYDESSPKFGIPTPLTEMNGLQKGPSDTKTVTSINAGITQVMNRFWLMELNYDIGWSNGYQTDPYKIVSMVDATTGMPLRYLYESRPDARTRQSIYLANKIAIWSSVSDLAFRYYHDSWGINSITGELSVNIPITKHLYIEPETHYYKQSAANFFNYYLLDGATPQYASADYRLSKFNALTLGVKLGYTFSGNDEMYIMAENYRQSGDKHIAGAPGDLANENFFSGIHSTSIMMGINFKF